MRCSTCNEFTGLDLQTPEVESLEVNEDGVVMASVRIVRNCSECGNEMKDAMLEMEAEAIELGKHKGDGHELSVEESSVEEIEEGGGRYAKSYFGAHVEAEVMCSCDATRKKRWSASVTMEDKVAASEMEEIG